MANELVKVEILESCSGTLYTFSRGQTVETTQEIARDLARAGHGRILSAPPAQSVKKAIPDTTKIEKR